MRLAGRPGPGGTVGAAVRRADLAAVVLAAGEGRRLRPLTTLRPKALCPVGNVPLLDGALDRVGRHSDHLAVNAHHLAQQVRDHLSDRRDVRLSVEDPVALGTAGAIGNLRAWLGGRHVLVHNADAWMTDPLDTLLDGWSGRCPGCSSPRPGTAVPTSPTGASWG